MSVLNVFTVDANNSASEIYDEQRASGQMLSMLIPYIIVVLLFSGTMSLGVDTIAGEKERGTMASLLLTPVSRMSIMMGQAAVADNIIYAVIVYLYNRACCRDADYNAGDD